MSIFSTAKTLALPVNPTSLIEGSVTSAISSGIGYGTDPAKEVIRTVVNVSGVNSNTANTLGPNFDRFSVLQTPGSFGVVGNLFQSGQDLLPISDIVSNFGGTYIGDELTQINPSQLLSNPGQEIGRLANNIVRATGNQIVAQGNSIARSVVQDAKDILRGAVNTILNPAAAATTNLGVVDSRLQYAYSGNLEVHKSYAQGAKDGSVTTLRGVEPLTNPYYVFRLNRAANGSTAGEDSRAQSRLLLDKEARRGVTPALAKTVTLSRILNRFGGFTDSNPTPYRAADFLWLKYYNRIPLTRLVTLRRYMYPIQDNFTRSPYLNKIRLNGWSNNPVSQMVTYFGGSSGNSLSEILKISASTTWESEDSKIQDVKLFNGNPMGATELAQSSKFANLGIKALGGLAGFTGGKALGLFTSTGVGSKLSSFLSGVGGKVAGSSAGSVTKEIGAEKLTAGILSAAGIVDPARATGLAQFRDTFNPYDSGGYLSDRYREPLNVVKSALYRTPGISGTVGGDSLNLTFEYSLKSIGHLNAKAAMLDILANVLATCHYRGSFWGGEARFYLDKGVYPLLDETQTLEFVKMIWSGDFSNATNVFTGIIRSAFGDIKLEEVPKIMQAALNAQTESSAATTGTIGSEGTARGATGGLGISGLVNAVGGENASRLIALDFLSGLFQLGGGSPALPTFQALKTGAPVGEWHLTVGNPFSPIAKIGNLVCDSVSVTFNDELGADDFPTEMKATVTLKPGRQRANQDIESVFNDGYGSLYIPKPDKFGNNAESVREQIAKDVRNSQLADPIPGLSEGILNNLNNALVINSGSLSPHVDNPAGTAKQTSLPTP